MSSRRGRFRSSESRPQKRQLVQGSTCGPLNRVVSTFGKAGDEHDGVTISFGKTQSAKAAADAHSYKDDNGLLKTDITFNSAFFGSPNRIQVAGVLVHERSHGIDGIARGNMDPQNRKQEFRSFIANFKPLPYWGFVLNSADSPANHKRRTLRFSG
jgi:hypothetical protein